MRVRSIMRRASVALSGGKPSARSLKTSTNWPPAPNNKHRPELRVNAAADDQFVAVQFDHRLHRHAEKMFLARLFRHGAFDRLPRPPHRRRIAQVQLHAANVGLVGDRFRIELQHDRKADARGVLDGLLLGAWRQAFPPSECRTRPEVAWIRIRSGWCGPACGWPSAWRPRCWRAAAHILRFGPQQRRFVKGAEVLAVTPHVTKRPRRAVRILERRDIRRVEDVLARRSPRPLPSNWPGSACPPGARKASVAPPSPSRPSSPAASESPATRRCSGLWPRCPPPWRTIPGWRRR